MPTKRTRTPRLKLAVNRSRLGHKIAYALTHPRRVIPHLRRSGRDAWLRLRHRDHVAYYRAVMASDAARDPRAAVGSRTKDRWLALGKMQFDYLRGHGLSPEHRMLDIGCGNLRGGWRFIRHLDAGNYYGIDISPDILISAKQTLVDYGLQEKLPHLTLTKDLTLDFLPSGHFDVVHAHSVFSHSPIEVIDECLAHVGRVLAPGGFFDFTFDRTEGTEHQVLREDFYYRTETLISLAERHGLRARFMEDWERLPHGQSKIRVSLAPESEPEPESGPGSGSEGPDGGETAGQEDGQEEKNSPDSPPLRR
ncbi:class I SAM-dependent methyltransferase [Streptomyces sp. 4N509B]|uniref:class I SAM-dependent methyltransferase n=1 Tax=Streptomyces sp. 4N509B TaxID=3457413 RepID=UPI003FD165DE